MASLANEGVQPWPAHDRRAGHEWPKSAACCDERTVVRCLCSPSARSARLDELGFMGMCGIGAR